MKKTEHSPLPWQLRPAGTRNDAGIVACNGYGVLTLLGLNRDANAELIVTAVNNHARLVKKLEELREILNLQPNPRLGDWDWPGMVYDIDKLIASVNEGSK